MPVLIERTRRTKHQLRAVYAYILRQREKGKQALAESKAKEEEERQRKREEQKKKETVEDVKKEIAELEEKLEKLKQKKHDLFSQFKKALNYEDEVRRQQELQAMKAATAHVVSSVGMQSLAAVQGHPQLALVDSGAIKRQGSPSHPLSGYIQAPISHSQKLQNFQPPATHVGYPPQTAQVYQAAQERYAGYQHSQGQVAVIGSSQPESRMAGKQQMPSGAASEPQPLFPRQPPLHQGGLPQKESQQTFSVHQLQQQPHQQQFAYHVQQQQQPGYQHYTQLGNQKQSLLPGPHPQAQPQSTSAQHNQGTQHGYPVTHTQDQAHLQSYHVSNMHPVQSQKSYQAHSQTQAYQSKQPVGYQAQQMPISGQHPFHSQPQQQPPPPPPPSQYPVAQGPQGQQEQVHRQQPVAPQQYHQQQGPSQQSEGRQIQYEGAHQSQQIRPPHQQQQQLQQHQKQEQRPSASLGYSQHYAHDYQPHHAQGSQSAKRSSHKYTPYPYSGSKGHHQGSAGKKYSGKYPSSVEGTSSGSYSGPSGSSSHSRHHHHQGRSHKGGASYSSSSQQKPSRYYQ